MVNIPSQRHFVKSYECEFLKSLIPPKIWKRNDIGWYVYCDYMYITNQKVFIKDLFVEVLIFFVGTKPMWLFLQTKRDITKQCYMSWLSLLIRCKLCIAHQQDRYRYISPDFSSMKSFDVFFKFTNFRWEVIERCLNFLVSIILIS